jgi:mannose-6-phosphate isomerase-like protein (cupin superfamily)
MVQHLGQAYPITWEAMKSIPLDGWVEYEFVKTRKLSEAKDKIVFESHLKKNELFYFSDFLKEFHVLDGNLVVEYKDGRKEYLKKNERTEISPYEPHKLIPSDKCKIVVTCIN